MDSRRIVFQSAQANLDRLLAEADEGKKVVIEREGKPARLLAGREIDGSAAHGAERVFGLDRGLVEYEDRALEPLSDEELVEYGFGLLLENRLVGEQAQAQMPR